MSNKDAIIMVLVFGFFMGVFNGYGTVIGTLSMRYGFSTVIILYE